MDPLATRRRLAPTSAVPSTTAEVQAQRHGISDDVSNALQGNVPARIRQSVASGRGVGASSSFGRTQSQPVFAFAPPTSAFQTNDDILRAAQFVISKEDLRRQTRELEPFGSGGSNGVDALDLQGSGAAELERGNRRLKFGADGEVEMEGEASKVGSGNKRTGGKLDWGLGHGKKRVAETDLTNEEDGNVSDTATEVDEDENQDATVTTNTTDEFPPVFTSPAISHPALFRSNQFPATSSGKGAMGPPQSNRMHLVGGGRQMRGLPGRKLGKTMSAPVLMGSGGMDVDEPERSTLGNDGFDVGEWAEDANF